MSKAYVLLSGGIDSTVCLYQAIADHGAENVVGVSIYYGQRHSKEISFATQSCLKLGVRHVVLNIPGIVPTTMLTDPDQPIPDLSYAEIKGVSPTYVPFRNGLLLSAITSFVHGEFVRDNKHLGSEWIVYFGAHAEDAMNWAYPDCTPEFIGAMANAIYIGTYRCVRLCAPLQFMTKTAIINQGEHLNVDWDLTWSCYRGGPKHCGTCPTCRARRSAFEFAEVVDPTEYQNRIPKTGAKNAIED